MWNKKKLVNLLLNVEKKQNLTQAQLGEKLGVTDKAVLKWENGLRLPDVTILNDLSNILNVTTTELLNGKSFTQDIQSITASETQYYQIINKELLLFLNDHYNNCSIYLVQSENSDYFIEGLIIDSKENDFINISFIKNKNREIDLVYSYEYSFSIENDTIYKIGNVLLYEYKKEDLAIPFNKILQEIKMYIIRKNNQDGVYVDPLSRNLVLQIKYINQNFEQKDIIISLSLNRIFANNRIVT